MTDIHVTVFWDVTSYTLVDTSVSVKSSTSIFRVEACLILWILSFLRNVHIYLLNSTLSRDRIQRFSPEDGGNSLLRNVVAYIGYHIPEGRNLHRHGHENLIVSQSVKELSVFVRHWFHHWSASNANLIKFVSSEFVYDTLPVKNFLCSLHFPVPTVTSFAIYVCCNHRSDIR